MSCSGCQGTGSGPNRSNNKADGTSTLIQAELDPGSARCCAQDPVFLLQTEQLPLLSMTDLLRRYRVPTTLAREDCIAPTARLSLVCSATLTSPLADGSLHPVVYLSRLSSKEHAQTVTEAGLSGAENIAWGSFVHTEPQRKARPETDFLQPQ